MKETKKSILSSDRRGLFLFFGISKTIQYNSHPQQKKRSKFAFPRWIWIIYRKCQMRFMFFMLFRIHIERKIYSLKLWLVTASSRLGLAAAKGVFFAMLMLRHISVALWWENKGEVISLKTNQSLWEFDLANLQSLSLRTCSDSVLKKSFTSFFRMSQSDWHAPSEVVF